MAGGVQSSLCVSPVERSGLRSQRVRIDDGHLGRCAHLTSSLDLRQYQRSSSGMKSVVLQLSARAMWISLDTATLF